jgi:LacI family transcriptional regulator
LHVPFVLIDRLIKGFEDRFVGNDDFNAGKKLTEYLIKRGHHRIGVIGWQAYAGDIGPRYDGYCAAMRGAGLEIDTRFITTTAEYFSGHDETFSLMRQFSENLPTALLILNDATVSGVLLALRELGKHIPDDVAVVNIGGQLDTTLMSIRLTGAALPVDSIAREAVRMLQAQIQGKDWQRGPIYCPVEIRVGNSA